jgi:signal transduction histidine kinase
MVRMNRLIAILGRSGTFESFLLDPSGSLLAHGDAQRVFSRLPVDGIPDEVWRPDRSWTGRTFEYTSSGIDMIGGFTQVETGHLLAGAQIPTTAVFLSARNLLKDLLGVSLVLLVSTAVIGLVWSHQMTRPLERLAKATQEVGKGEFDIQVKATSRDEIGNLSSSFNQMASELRDREKALQDAQAALIQSEKMSAFGQLSAGIAHEVKNPLAGILGYAQLSMKKVDKDSPIIKNLKTIERETKRCNAIIGNLMKFARQEQTEFSSTVINQVVEDAIGIVDHQLGVHQIRVEKELAENLPAVTGNANQLQQVLMNIMINAQQAMDGQPGTVRVVTRLSDDGSVQILVSDTGPGLSPDIQERIFEPFFTTKPAGQGTGLGLSVTYGIIKDHRGSIRVESTPGEGATFIIALPPGAPDEPEKKPGEAT